jgi:hypothetical protein
MFEEDIDVIEVCFIAINKEADIGIKQEENPEEITFPDIKPEPAEVSYMCICLLLDRGRCWVVGKFCTRWVGLQVIA